MDMHTDDNDAVLVQSAVDLGHNLGLAVVAEGVEDSGTLERLRSMGCDLAQGYHISRPVRPEALESWLDAAAPVNVPAAGAPDPRETSRG
jgi:EAL domain-containing protein (putative c-di-GMP-specific phosphodiesterase class I)